MIRQVEFQDAKAITDIYNEYVLHSVATFDTEPVQEEEMRARITEISSRFPYFVYEEEKKSPAIVMPIRGKSVQLTAIRWKQLFTCLPDIQERASGCS